MNTLFALGNIWIADYKIWINTPIFSVDPLSSEAESLPYYEVMVSKRMLDWPIGYYSYVDLFKEILQWDMTDRNPLARPKDKEDLTLEEAEFKEEYNSHVSRKGMTMPLVKLSRRHIEKLLLFIKGIS
jgi:hypothetical protein